MYKSTKIVRKRFHHARKFSDKAKRIFLKSNHTKRIFHQTPSIIKNKVLHTHKKIRIYRLIEDENHFRKVFWDQDCWTFFGPLLGATIIVILIANLSFSWRNSFLRFMLVTSLLSSIILTTQNFVMKSSNWYMNQKGCLQILAPPYYSIRSVLSLLDN